MARTGASRVQGGQVQVEGLAELQRAMRRMSASLKDLTAVNRAAAVTVAEAARDRAPVSRHKRAKAKTKSGALRKSIRPGANKDRGYVAAGGGAVVYAGPIHFGWFRRNIDPNPFIYDALDARKGEVIERYQQHVEGLVKRLDRETPG